MRILITGKTGQVGFELRRALASLGELVVADRLQCDLSSGDKLRMFVREVAPNVVVNAGAYTAVDRAESEKDLAIAVNSNGPGILGEEASRLGALVVHYSTDYVFDGSQARPYTEDDTPDPINAYGYSKLMGERYLEESCRRHLIFRTSWVLGANGTNFARSMLRLAAARDALDIVSDQVGAPTSASLIADVTALLVRDATRSPEEFPYGLYHLTCSGSTTWHEYACYVIDRARLAGQPVRIRRDAIRAIRSEDYPTAALRPANSCLDTSRLRRTFGLQLPHWKPSVDYTLEQIFGS